MKIKKILIIVGVVAAFTVAALISLRMYTKSFSPEGSETYSKGTMKITVTYSRPYKKGRIIFGELVPYGEVWRTGANEPTIFTTSTDLIIGEGVLKKGSYSLFTIPGKKNWKVIFNHTIPGWGINFLGQTTRNEQTDALIINAPVIKTKSIIEQFTINFEEMHDEVDMVFMWDRMLVVVPMALKTE